MPNITYVLGNGFDLNFGLKTSYKDFYDYYVEQDSEHESVKRIKVELRKFIKEQNNKIESEINWSDLESALAEYTTKEESVYEYILLLKDINKHLNLYLIGQNELFNPSQYDLNKLVEDFLNPEKYLYGETKVMVENRLEKNKSNGHNTNIEVVTFNYTNLADQIVEEVSTKSSPRVRVNSVLHVHGELRNAILGVNSRIQIENINFRKSDELVNRLVKPIINGEDRNITVNLINNTILSSDYIVLFGASLGVTDREWALKISAWIEQEDRYILYFPYQKGADTSNSTERCVVNKRHKLDLKKKLELSDDTFVSIQHRIYIGCNTNLFKGYEVNQVNNTMLLPNYAESTITK